MRVRGLLSTAIPDARVAARAALLFVAAVAGACASLGGRAAETGEWLAEQVRLGAVHADEEVRLACVGALGELGDDRELELLVRIACTDPSVQVRCAAIRGMIFASTESAREAAKVVLEANTDPDALSMALLCARVHCAESEAHAIAKLADEQTQWWKRDQALLVAAGLGRVDRTADVLNRYAAAEAGWPKRYLSGLFVLIHDPDAVDVLEGCLDSDDWLVRHRAAVALDRIGSASARSIAARLPGHVEHEDYRLECNRELQRLFSGGLQPVDLQSAITAARDHGVIWIGESHSVPAIMAAERYILDELSSPDRRRALVYERCIESTQALREHAHAAGWDVFGPEPPLDGDWTSLVRQRDAVIASCVAQLHQSHELVAVVYGRQHVIGQDHASQLAGVRAPVVLLSGPLRGALYVCGRNPDLRGRTFGLVNDTACGPVFRHVPRDEAQPLLAVWDRVSGLGRLNAGMSQDAVRQLIGNPSRVIVSHSINGPHTWESWWFGSLHAELTFLGTMLYSWSSDADGVTRAQPARW